MGNGMWPSVSGASARSQAVDMVANNLANVDTAGFKQDQPTFKEYVSAFERTMDAQEPTRLPIKDKDLYPLDGKEESHVIIDGTYTNFRPGALKVTNRTLDVAVEGPGFFEVSTPQGVRFTRQGSFHVTTDGLLVTPEGYPVLAAQPGGRASAQLPTVSVQPSQGGLVTQGGVAADQTARYISLKDGEGPLSITEKGEIFLGTQSRGKLGVVEFKDRNQLRKIGSHLFSVNNLQNIDRGAADETGSSSRVLQGMIETSNVNPIEEMTNLIRANRLFEADLKSIKTFNDIMGKEVNEVGKL